MKPRRTGLSQWLWFLGLWVAGVAVLGVVAIFLRWVIGLTVAH
jgi:hypothetical protein